MILGLVFALALCGDAIQVKWAQDFSSYSVEDGPTVLFQAASGVGVFLDKQWHSLESKSLKLGGARHVNGSHPILGLWSGTEVTWLAGEKPTKLVTTAQNFNSGHDVVFEVTFPDGAAGTSADIHLEAGSQDDVIVNFPAFTTVALPSALSWQGAFVQAQLSTTTGLNGGPTVFYNNSDAKLQTVVVGSSLNNFKAFSAGPGKDWKGIKAWAPGTPGTIDNLPVGYSQQILLHVGTGEGVTAAVHEWGQILQQIYKAYKLPDVTLEKIGYQTDNGAYYVFCQGNCSDTLLKTIADLKEQKVPMGYLSFQGAGASSDAGAGETAPWCVGIWGPDKGGLGQNFPVPLKQFQEALDIPLQLYAPYFCMHSPYFNNTNWTSVTSNTSLPGCDGYAFENIQPSQSKEFYDWFLSKGQDVGMASFEPDFMDHNYFCVEEHIRTVDQSFKWQHGMADAALAKNIAVQWCFALPSDVMAALTMPAVTNFRVSSDFCYGESWNIGLSSIIVWAMGASPSKDTLWTSTNKRYSVPGCDWTPDHETPAIELHVVLALMSTGPVGISDGLGMENAHLARRVIRNDGVLLKPSKPITATDSSFGPAAGAGYTYTTYSETTGFTSAWYFVTFKLKTAWQCPQSDLFPKPLFPGTKLVHRFFDGGVGCVNGTHTASKCLSKSSDQVFTAPASDFSNVTGGTDFAPVVTTVWPVCANDWALLGDLTKYVAVSPLRFSNIRCSVEGLNFTVLGSVGEIVPVWILSGKDSILTINASIPSSGFANLSFP